MISDWVFRGSIVFAVVTVGWALWAAFFAGPKCLRAHVNKVLVPEQVLFIGNVPIIDPEHWENRIVCDQYQVEAK